MGFWKTLFGGEEETPEQEQQHQAERDFDVLKTDGQKASRLGRHEYAVPALVFPPHLQIMFSKIP